MRLTSLVRSFLPLALFGALAALPSGVSAQGTAFSYQGHLQSGGAAATGLFDLEFRLFGVVSGGVAAAPANSLANVPVTNGLFTVTLNFGGAFLDGFNRWIEIAVRPGGTMTPFATLVPRQRVLPTPYAITAMGLSGPVPDAQISPNIPRLDGTHIFTGLSVFSPPAGPPFEVGSADVVLNLNADLLDGLDSGDFWKTAGNGGTTAGTHFVGTTDAQPLELRVNSTRALRLEPTTGAPNVIGGDEANVVVAGTTGAAIGGGLGHVVSGEHGTIAGGLTNMASGLHAAVLGGFANEATGQDATAGGGFNNFADGDWSVVAGGFQNVAAGEDAFIGGGFRNTVLGLDSAVVGGEANGIDTNATFSFIGGGRANGILGVNLGATIGGGRTNVVQSGNFNALIAGGRDNLIQINCTSATIGGGTRNLIQTNADFGTIAGGNLNIIRTNADFATISGGFDNVVQRNATYATIPGGRDAFAISYGQMAYSAGANVLLGDSQTSTFVVRRNTTNSVPTELFADGAGRRMLVPANGSWTFDALITARSPAGVSAGWQVRGVVKSVGATVSLVGATTSTLLGADAGAALWMVSVEADDVNDALVIKGTGDGAAIRWSASVRTSELIF